MYVAGPSARNVSAVAMLLKSGLPAVPLAAVRAEPLWPARRPGEIGVPHYHVCAIRRGAGLPAPHVIEGPQTLPCETAPSAYRRATTSWKRSRARSMMGSELA